MFRKVIEISNNKTEEVYDSFFGSSYLYPNETIRVIIRYNIFNGWKKITQSCSIDYSIDSGGMVIHYNKWKTIKKESINYWQVF